MQSITVNKRYRGTTRLSVSISKMVNNINNNEPACAESNSGNATKARMAMPQTWDVSIRNTKMKSKNGGSLKALNRQKRADRNRVKTSGVANANIKTQIQATYKF